MTFADEYTARAMEILIFCPPDKFRPRSPTSVKSPLGINSISDLRAHVSIIFS